MVVEKTFFVVRDKENNKTSLQKSNVDISLLNKKVYLQSKEYKGDFNNLNEIQADLLIKKRSEILLKLLNREIPLATEIMVEWLCEKRRFVTVKSDKSEEIYYYAEGIYVANGMSEIKRLLRMLLHDAYKNSFLNVVALKIMSDTFIDAKIFFNSNTEYAHIIPLLNGLFNLENKELSPFYDHQKFFFKKLNVTYEPENKNDVIEKFIRSIVSNEEDVMTLQETIGYGLLRDYRYEKAFMWYGNGRNGKSKLINVINELYGSENVTFKSMSELEKTGNYVLKSLKDSFFNFCSDLDNNALNNTGVFRSLTGRDVISADRKYLECVNFVNHAKLIFASNGLPNPHKVTNAFWLRWVVVKFPYTFLPQKELDDLKNNGSLTPLHKLQNPLIINNLTTPKSLNGFFNWILQGLDRLILNNDFSFSKSLASVKNSWLRESNSFISFVQDCAVVDYDDYVTKAVLKREYVAYCNLHKVDTVSDKFIMHYLTKELAVIDDRKYFNENGFSMQMRIWAGIKLKNNVVKQTTIN